MTIETSWYIPGKVLYHQYVGVVNLEEVRQSSVDAHVAYVENGHQRQHYIIDLSGTTRLDVSLQGLRNLKTPEGNTGWSVVVTNGNTLVNNFTRFLSVAASQVLGIRLRLVNSLAEAEAFLAEMDTEVAMAFHKAS